MLDQRGADIVIKGFVPGSPAAAQKELHEGDRVVSINSQGGAAVSVRGMELAAVLALIRGPEGATVSISAVPPAEDDSHAKTVQLIRVSLDIVDSSLKPGEVAPELSNVTWIKGDPVPKFARDKVYIIECWATWCGPCVANIPHLDALHRKFQDQGLVVIGQNIWEEDAAKVRKFVEKMGDKMSFRVALDDYSAASAGERPADTMPKGAMSEAWIRPGRGGSYGIPQAFLVGKDGKVIWSGHPAKLTETMIETALNVAVKAQSE